MVGDCRKKTLGPLSQHQDQTALPKGFVEKGCFQKKLNVSVTELFCRGLYQDVMQNRNIHFLYKSSQFPDWSIAVNFIRVLNVAKFDGTQELTIPQKDW